MKLYTRYIISSNYLHLTRNVGGFSVTWKFRYLVIRIVFEDILIIGYLIYTQGGVECHIVSIAHRVKLLYKMKINLKM